MKNYIGFETYEQMNIFMNEELLKIYKNKIPNNASRIIAIFCAFPLLGLFIFSISRFTYNDVPNDEVDPNIITTSKLGVGGAYFIIFSGYFIYFIYAYLKNYKKSKYWEIKKINSDILIQDFITELSRGKNITFILIIIILLSISFLFFILTWLVKPLHKIYLRNTKKEKINTREDKNDSFKDISKKYSESSEKVHDKDMKNNLENINSKLDEKIIIKDLNDSKSKKETNSKNGQLKMMK